MKTKEKQIVAIGGAMAKSIRASRLIMSQVLGLVPANSRPKLLQINTACGDTESSALSTYRMLSGLSCQPAELTFFARTPQPEQLRQLILSQDVIFVGGGNTKSMLAVWREYGLPDILREAWDSGVIMAGSSAGGICWFEQCLTDSYADEYTALDCLGFLPGSCCPHFDGEPGRKETYHRLVASGELQPGIAIDERVAVHYAGERIQRVITTDKRAGAYLVYPRGSTVMQSRLAKTVVN